MIWHVRHGWFFEKKKKHNSQKLPFFNYKSLIYKFCLSKPNLEPWIYPTIYLKARFYIAIFPEKSSPQPQSFLILFFFIAKCGFDKNIFSIIYQWFDI